MTILEATAVALTGYVWRPVGQPCCVRLATQQCRFSDDEVFDRIGEQFAVNETQRTGSSRQALAVTLCTRHVRSMNSTLHPRLRGGRESR